MDLYKLNKYQTPITEELQKSLPKEVWEDLIDFIGTIKFIQNLIAPEEIRGFAKDRPKDKSGKIIVDLTNPHILEDMDFFRERAIFFEKNKCYTHLRPNPNPRSEFAEFWREEQRRWVEGLVRPSDGEWIPGYYYFYLNYGRIWLNEKADEGNEKIKKKATREMKFPKIWLGDYLFFHYFDQAIENGKHAKILKCRGCGFSFKTASISPCNMYTRKGLPNFHLAIDKRYLDGKDGLFDKILINLDWLAKNTPWPRMRLIDKPSDYTVQLGNKDEYGNRQGYLSSVTCISLKDDPEKARGLRGPLIHYEEDGQFKDLESAWNVNRDSTEDGDLVFGTQFAGGCVCAGTKVWTNDGKYINIEDIKQGDGILGFDIETEEVKPQTISWLQPPIEKECIELSTSYRTLRCSLDHPILVREKKLVKTNEIVGTRKDYYSKLDKWYETPRYKKEAVYTKAWKEAGKISKVDTILIAEGIDVWGKETLFDARLVGMLIGDGSYGMHHHYGKLEFGTPRFSNCDAELNSYIESNYPHTVGKARPTKDGRIYKEISIRGLVQKLKDIGIAGQSKAQKRLPINYMNLTKEDSALLIAGLYDTDGYICTRGPKTAASIGFTQSSKELILQVKELLEKFGINSVVSKKLPNLNKTTGIIDKNPWYNLVIASKQSVRNFYKNIPLLITYKKDKLSQVFSESFDTDMRIYNTFENIIEEKIRSVKKIGKQKIYNLTAEENNTYLANNIITHNTSGLKAANFEGSEKLFRNPNAYNINGIPNVFDKNSDGSVECGFFWPAYLNRALCYDKASGEPDVIKALLEILRERFTIKYNSSDPLAITQRKAEKPVTPAEATMRTSGTIFPVSDLKEYLADIKMQGVRFWDRHYVGDLVLDKENIKWQLADKYPIRSYQFTGNTDGAIEIFEMPKLGADKLPMKGRYIAGIDPYDDDSGTSLGSIFIFDMFFDTIVAEYTGRPKFANDFYETCKRMLLFYDAKAMYENNKKGLFTYFSQQGCTYLLAENPKTLKDQEMMRKGNYGNKAYGVHATAEINSYARRLQKYWMLTVAHPNYQDTDEQGNIITSKLNLQLIRSMGYLEEAIAWNSDGNFDRISSLGMCMILREEKKQFVDGIMNQNDPTKDIVNNDYFLKNYDNKYKNFSHTEIEKLTDRYFPKS